MKSVIILIVLLVSGCSSISHKNTNYSHFESKVISNEKMSCRAIFVDETKVWLGMDKGRIGVYDKQKDTLVIKTIANVSNTTEFRSIASTKNAIFVLSVGNPAMLIKIDKNTLQETIVYREDNEKVFYDSMQFADELNGFAMGDPILDCMAMIKTSDGGTTWQKISCNKLPKVTEGEAAFATSNTNLTVKDKTIFMVSGGKKARVFVSNDFSETWKVYETPIVQGEEMTGIFTADFYDTKRGIIAGGNYMKQTQNSLNKAITKNGGKTWELIANNEAFGYASCVQFVPNSKGEQLISVGGTGMFYSSDFGKSWIKFSDDNQFYTFRFESDTVFYATGKNQLVRFEMK
ncbi:WD40/YVTN/BNR-like repeat-containing protein [Flavobacterium sp.]|uniref:WD40/YVTN/BNR-like repeat-containing protein n=3 Tax=Flavobacterium sp. TaxID=239 RepID=UPI0040480A3B